MGMVCQEKKEIDMKKILKLITICIILLIGSIFIPNKIIISNAEELTYNSISEIPKNKVGLLLGTSKYLANGNINLYYKYRINATSELYKSGKIDFVLVSGDNSTKSYDEPSTFKNDLITKGIPEEKIFLDYAGFRTLDSVIRAKEIFGLEAFTVISQKFHNERAIYLAKKYGIQVVGFNAKDVEGRSGFKTKLREYFARTKAVLDVITGKSPKFLGDKIKIK